jgi:thymidylate synthase
MKVLIRSPEVYSHDELRHFNISTKDVEDYQNDLLLPDFTDPAHSRYTYGQRLGSHFKINMLEAMAADLCLDKDSRYSLATLWDNSSDPKEGDSPCLITLFFRKIEDRVNLTATFRSHNAARAWPINCLGLVAVMQAVCNKANANPGKTDPAHLRPGSLTVFSQSISIDLSDIDNVKKFIDEYLNKSVKLVMDPNGYFKITLNQDTHEIVAYQHSHEDEMIEEYRGRSPSDIAKQLYKHAAISDISHALYLGSQLERAWFCLENGLEYIQDKTVISCPE